MHYHQIDHAIDAAQDLAAFHGSLFSVLLDTYRNDYSIEHAETLTYSALAGRVIVAEIAPETTH